MNQESGLQLGDLGGVLRRRASLIAGIAGAIFLAAYWIAMALPNQYEAYATLLVEPQAISDELVEAGVAESDLNNRLHLMSAEILSRPRLSRVIDDLGLYEAESASQTREEIIDAMRDSIRVAPLLPELEEGLGLRNRDIEINTFQIYFSHRSPATAALVAQRLANDFIGRHIDERVRQTQKGMEFVQAERDAIAKRLSELEKAIAGVKEENPGKLPEDVNANQRLMERNVTELRAAERALDVARSDEAFWANQAINAASAARANDDASPARKLQLLELALADYKARGFTEKHPDVRKAKIEIDAIQRQIEEQTRRSQEDGAPASFIQQNADAERRRAALRVKASEEEIARLREQLAEVEKRLEETPRVAEQLDALAREYEALGASEIDFANRALEAQVQADMERRQLGENFRVIEAAFPPGDPSSPNRLLILLMGLFLGVAVGGAAGILAETADSSVHGARELQSALGVPVLASIPVIVLDSDLAERMRRRVKIGLAATAVVLVCLGGGAATYVYVNGGPGWLKPGGGSAPAGVAAQAVPGSRR